MAAFEPPTAAAAHTTNGAATAGNPRNQDSARLAREAGWVEPTPFDYTTTVPTGSGFSGPNDSTEEAQESVHKSTTWAHDANKYEWQNSYGEVGPRNEGLEKELFHGEHINRVGDKFDK